jgi:hypothetical protein
MKSVVLITDYDVEDKPVQLTVLVGDAQVGASVVKLGKKILASGEIDKLDLGNGKQLRGKPLFVKSAVTDVNDSTNQTSLTYEFKCGAKRRRFQSEATVDEDGDSVIYRAKFNIV